MAVFSQTGGSNGGNYAKNFTGRLTVWRKTKGEISEERYNQSIEGNYSILGRRLELVSGSAGRFSDYGASWSINVDGQTKSGSGTYASMSYNTAQTIYEDEIIVYHNNDGTKKNMSCSATLDFASGIYSPGDFNLSGTMDLTTIPRASSISATDANIGSTSTVMINRVSDSFTHTVEYSFEGLTGIIATKTKETTIPFDIPTTFFEKIPEAQSGVVSLTCYTYSGDTLVGTKSGSLNVGVPSSGNYDARPLIDSATARDTNPNTLALTGNDPTRLVTYKSNVKISVTGRCIYHGAFKVLRSSQTQIPATTSSENGTTTVSGSITHNACDKTSFLVFLGDKRGLYKEQPLNEANGDFKIVPYIPLTMSVEAKRVSPTSNSAKLNFTGNFYNGYYDEAKSNFNNLTIKWRYKLRDSGSWITAGADDTTNGWHNLTLNKDFKYNQNENTYSSIDDVIIEDLFDYQENYTIEIQYQDRLSSYTTPQPILAGVPNHDYGKDANGKNYFNVNGGYYQEGESLIEIIYPVGSIYMSVNNVNPKTLFGGEWEAWGVGKVPVGVDTSQTEFATVEKTGGEKNVTLTENQLPKISGSAIGVHTYESGYWGHLTASKEGSIGVTSGDTTHWSTLNFSFGGDESHNNLQPYITCYMFKRTA